MKKFIFLAVLASLVCAPFIMGSAEIEEEVLIYPEEEFYNFGQDKVQKDLSKKLNI